MNSVDIKVGGTYRLQRDSFSRPLIVRIERVLMTQAERAEVIRAERAENPAGSHYREQYDKVYTIEVTPLVKLESDGSVVEVSEDKFWVRPAAIPNEDTIEAAEERYIQRTDARVESERAARARVKRITEALDGFNLPLPTVREPDAWRGSADRYTVAYPKWGAGDYDRLVDILKDRA